MQFPTAKLTAPTQPIAVVPASIVTSPMLELLAPVTPCGERMVVTSGPEPSMKTYGLHTTLSSYTPDPR